MGPARTGKTELGFLEAENMTQKVPRISQGTYAHSSNTCPLRKEGDEHANARLVAHALQGSGIIIVTVSSVTRSRMVREIGAGRAVVGVSVLAEMCVHADVCGWLRGCNVAWGLMR